MKKIKQTLLDLILSDIALVGKMMTAFKVSERSIRNWAKDMHEQSFLMNYNALELILSHCLAIDYPGVETIEDLLTTENETDHE